MTDEQKEDCFYCDVRERVMGRIKEERIRIKPCWGCDCRQLFLAIGIIIAAVIVYLVLK